MSRTLNIVGCGRVGRALGALLVRNSICTRVAICNRTVESSARAASFVPSSVAVSGVAELPAADCWMVACADSAVPEVVAVLAESSAVAPGALVFHVSGALSSHELSPLAKLGARLGSLHPVRSIASPELVISSFGGTACAIEGEPAAVSDLRGIVEGIGGRPFEVDARSKLICHAGHVFASNYVVTVLDVARRLYADARIPDDVVEVMLPPIVRGTIENVCALGTTAALTGPVARGDVALVRRQLSELSELNPEVAALYRELVRHAARLAARRGELPPSSLSELECIARGELL